MSDVADIRRRYAHALRETVTLRSNRLVDAFASVPRERFLGEGPWDVCVIADDGQPSYHRTATADPAEVYRDVLIAIDASRGLNNGEPSSLASWLDTLDVAASETVVHIGAGTGYYTAILAELAGTSGHVHAFEIDPVLAARARANLAGRANVTVALHAGDDIAACSVDAMFVNCGVTHANVDWLKWLRDGGRLLFPVTAAPGADGSGYGAMYLASRHHEKFPIRYVSGVGIFPCTGQRSSALNGQLLAKDKASWRDVRALRIDSHVEGRGCWLHTAECCLSTLEPHSGDAQ